MLRLIGCATSRILTLRIQPMNGRRTVRPLALRICGCPPKNSGRVVSVEKNSVDPIVGFELIESTINVMTYCDLIAVTVCHSPSQKFWPFSGWKTAENGPSPLLTVKLMVPLINWIANIALFPYTDNSRPFRVRGFISNDMATSVPTLKRSRNWI